MCSRIEQNGDLDIPLRDATFSRLTALRAFFLVYGFDSSQDTLLVTFYPGNIPDNATTSSTCGMTAGSQAMNNGGMVMFLYGFHRLMARAQLHAKGDLGRIQQKDNDCVIFQEDTMATRESKRFTLITFPSVKIGIVHSCSTSSDLMKTMLNFTTALEK